VENDPRLGKLLTEDPKAAAAEPASPRTLGSATHDFVVIGWVACHIIKGKPGDG